MSRSVLTALLALSCAFIFAGCATSDKKNYVSVGNDYARDGLLREAAESYKKALAARPENATANRNLGLVLVKLGDYKAAVRHLEKAMSRYEGDFDANFYLGEAYRATDKYAEAIFRYKSALRLDNDNPKALKPLAWSYFKIRYYSEALEAGKKLTKVASADDQTAIIVSRTLLKLKRPGEALKTLRLARKSIQKSSIPYYNSVEGDILFEMGKTKSAGKLYRDALREQPLLAGALLGLGRCLLQEGKTDKAITFMERAVRIRPLLTEAHYLLGQAYEKTDRQKSLKYYQHFRRQAAADPEYLALINDVKNRIATLQSKRSTN